MTDTEVAVLYNFVVLFKNNKFIIEILHVLVTFIYHVQDLPFKIHKT